MASTRHKRDTDARRKPRAALVAGPLAILATASAVTVGVLTHDPSTSDVAVAHDASADIAGAVADRDPVSRSGSRVDALAAARAKAQQEAARKAAAERRQAALEAKQAREARLATERAVQQAHVHRWTTTLLNLWTGSGADATQVGLVESGTKVLVTGRAADGRTEIVWEGASRWVTSGYLADSKPKPEPKPSAASRPAAPAGLSMEPCPDSSVESGLTSSAVYVYRSVCHAFPQITSYGGWDAHGEHSSGKAIDIMTTDKALGDQIAAFLQSHASELDLYDVIWWDQIWTPVRASEGWRDYGDHGSATANHMDHVHVSTN